MNLNSQASLYSLTLKTRKNMDNKNNSGFRFSKMKFPISSNLQKPIVTILSVTILSTVLLSSPLLSEDELKPHDPPIQNKWMPTARGGQFKDLLLPIPIVNRLTSKGIWGHPNVLPRDVQNGFDSNDWYFWGGNPILNDDGRYHVAICRWPAANKFSPGWRKSHAAHYVSESGNPLGPYTFTHIIAGMHNPETIRLPDGTYALSGMANKAYLAEKMEGPWKSGRHEDGNPWIQTSGRTGVKHDIQSPSRRQHSRFSKKRRCHRFHNRISRSL